MKTKTYILLLLTSSALFSQNKNIFEVKTFVKPKAEIKQTLKKIDSLNNKMAFFEDEKYIVQPDCRGEWGGAIIFQNKRTNAKFICESTCPVAVTKFKGKYIITNSLNHMVSSTEVLEIVNPEKLNKAPAKDVRISYEKLGKTGAKTLIDVYSYSGFFSFVYKEKLYHIISGKEGTFVAEILNGKFVQIQKISDEELWTYNHQNLTTKDSTLIIFYTYKFAGYFEIKANTINLYITPV